VTSRLTLTDMNRGDVFGEIRPVTAKGYSCSPRLDPDILIESEPLAAKGGCVSARRT